MELVKPAFGLIFWMAISFGVILFILKKYAWKPILNMLHEREQSIQTAIDSAQKMREEMAALKSDNEKIIVEAKIQRDLILKEAREIKDKMVADAKNQAAAEADRLTAIAREIGRASCRERV